MPIHARNFVSSTTDRALGGSVIERSLRFKSADDAYLSRTPSSAGNRKTWTWSGWIKFCSTSTGNHVFGGGANCGGDRTAIFFPSGKINTDLCGIGAYEISDGFFRDFNGWYHFVWAFDTTQATASNRSKIYVNGSEISVTRPRNWSQNTDYGINNNTLTTMGTFSNSIGSYSLDGYMADIHFLDGYAYDSSYFGYTESQTGLWRPKKYEGAYGTNGFHLEFKDNSSTTTLGKDTSGNGNDFTLNNFSVGDCVRDTPSNNFSTLNQLSSGLSWADVNEGNLRLSSGNAAWTPVSSSMVMSSGKWYWEVYVENVGTYSMFGILPTVRQDDRVQHTDDRYPGTFSDEWGYANNGALHNSASPTNSWGATFTTGDIISFALDMDEGKLNIYKNGSATGSQITGISASNKSSGSRGEYRVNLSPFGTSARTVINLGQDGTFAGNKTSQGNTDASGLGDFYYSAPAGYKALCSKNLPPNVPSIIRSQKHFDTILYTGNASTQKITGLEFKPDMIWFKSRTSSSTHGMADSVRGRSKLFYPDTNQAEETSDSTRDLVSFDDGGFTVGNPQRLNSTNGSGLSIVAWCWKAGGAAVTNTDGTINTQVSVNEEAGFSIATYTGNGATTATIGHGLGKTPAWIIIKNRSSSADWVVMHEGIGSYDGGNYKHQPIKLNSSGAKTSILGIWQTPNSSTQQISDGQTSSGNRPLTNTSGDNYAAYFWAEIPGFSKFGKYEGNGQSEGPFIHLGFRPAWLMIKNRDNSERNWDITTAKISTFNVIDKYINANGSGVEGTYTYCDFLSNGFKLRNTGNTLNANSNKYIYMAFAEQPDTTAFDTFSNAR